MPALPTGYSAVFKQTTESVASAMMPSWPIAPNSQGKSASSGVTLRSSPRPSTRVSSTTLSQNPPCVAEPGPKPPAAR